MRQRETAGKRRGFIRCDNCREVKASELYELRNGRRAATCNDCLSLPADKRPAKRKGKRNKIIRGLRCCLSCDEQKPYEAYPLKIGQTVRNRTSIRRVCLVCNPLPMQLKRVIPVPSAPTETELQALDALETTPVDDNTVIVLTSPQVLYVLPDESYSVIRYAGILSAADRAEAKRVLRPGGVIE